MQTVAILDDEDRVVNVILAEPEFCDEHYPGKWVPVEGLAYKYGDHWNGSAFE